MSQSMPPFQFRRFSSRRERLDRSFLCQRLAGARSYDRIAGYFCSSLLEVAGEELESVSGTIRMIANSDLDPADVETARAAQMAVRKSWCAFEPEKLLEGNMRYRDSVEDRVHQLLSNRLRDIFDLFGQVPDVLEDVWVAVALGDREAAKRIIDELPQSHPFELRYTRVEKINWESCRRVLDEGEKQRVLRSGW